MGKIFGISGMKVNLFPSLDPYVVPAPICLPARTKCERLVKSLKPYVAETEAQRYYFRRVMNPNSRHLWKTKDF